MPHTFDVEASEILIETPIVAMRRDRVTMPGGGSATREILEHFGAVAVVAYRDEQIALIRQYRHALRQRLWELPAGLLDTANERPVDAARRELAEEAGYAAGRWRTLIDVVPAPGFCDEAVRIFLAEELSEISRPDPQDEEADLELQWVDLSKAVEMVFDGGIVNSIAIAGVFAAAEGLREHRVFESADTPFDLRPTTLSSRRLAAGYGPDLKFRP